MCGIIGYVGSRPAKSLLLGGLERLEYRGYDSAGLALLEDEGLDTSARSATSTSSRRRPAGTALMRPPGSGTRAGPRTAGSRSRTRIR